VLQYQHDIKNNSPRMLTHIIPTLLTFLHLTHALPTTTNIKRESTIANETWTIPRLDMHMMSTTTGLPGNTWPLSAYFNTTISFDILLPSHTSSPSNTTISTTCIASFPNGTLPTGLTYCLAPSPTEALWFTMSPYTDLGPRRPELSFVLSLESAVGLYENNTMAERVWWGDKVITANDPSEESSFLTCLEGAPLDGLRCGIKSYLSVREELTLDIWGLGGEGGRVSLDREPGIDEGDK
jgi:hypothetical protein